MRRTFAMAVVMFLLACKGCSKTPDVVDAGPPPPPAQVVAPLIIDAGDAAEPEGEPDQEGGPSREEAISAYEEDCHAELQITVDDMGEFRTGPDCTTVAFDQYCAPDLYGCFDAVQKCQTDCGDPCTSCQEKCATTCDACKTSCDGGACITSCATARADCRQTCMDAVEACRTDDCMVAFKSCESEGDARREAQCPDCEAIGRCLETGKKNCVPKGNARECAEWCYVE